MKKAFVAIIALAAVAFVAYRYYNKPHRTVDDEAGIRIEAPLLFEAFAINEAEANNQYLDRVLMVAGIVSSSSQNQEGRQVIILKTNDPLFGVSCTMSEPIADVQAGQSITLRGFCKGYLSDVVLTECKVAK